jgi:predicted dinucleotide-binding enzyme
VAEQEVGEAIRSADVVVLAVPGQTVAALVEEHGSALGGKVVVDAANRIGQPEVNSRRAVAEAAPTSRYVRAFNTLGWENFAEPLEGADLFFAADSDARSLAEELITDVGLRPVYVGDADASGTVDALLPLWFALVQQRGGVRRLAFRLVEQQ